MYFITTKFPEILSGFRGVALTKKKGWGTGGLTGALTDRRTYGSKTLYPPQLIAWGTKASNMQMGNGKLQ